MSSAVIKGYVGLSHSGNIYNCSINSHTILADDESELFDVVGKVIEPEYLAPFEGKGFTWTFVRDDSAEHYEAAKANPENRVHAGTSATMALAGIGASGLRPFMVYASLGTYEALDWIEANTTHRVVAWTLPATDLHFYLFEDAKEAMLFKLQAQA